ncbi:MAG: hypothetical protein A2Y15_00900 [Clostridiales bacterium GWF2_36_10]|nr:MAG: hypothetical protein A2Y15_00900 [Clostridiales bacterium GWF2_36_10]
MILKKAFSLMICLIISAAMLVSCENVKPVINTSNPDGEEEEEQVSQLPSSEEYEGTEFTVAVPSEKYDLFIRDEESESIVGSAVEKRNQLINNKYGVNIEVKTVNINNVSDELKAAQEAGINFADLLCLPGETLVSLVNDKLLYNLLSSADFDIESMYIDTEDAKSITVNNSLYMLYDSATQYYDDSWIVFYDKDLIANAGLLDPAYLAENGEWTWEKFKEYSETVASAVMNKGTVDNATDIFGFSSFYSKSELPLAMWESCGVPMFGDTYRKEVAITSNLTQVQESTDTLELIYLSNSCFKKEGIDVTSAFLEGRLAFFVGKLNYAISLEEETQKGNYKREWGLLPLPKLNKLQSNYCTFVDPDAYAFAIPANITDATRSVTILNAFCAASGDSIKNAVYNKYVNKFFRNNTSTVLFKTILDTGYFDMAALFGSRTEKVADISTELIIDAIVNNGALERPISDKLAGFIAYSKENYD